MIRVSTSLVRSRDRAPRGGFTLIEMVVTIGIIILAAGFLAPAVATMFQSRRLENAGTLISTVMNEARQSAVTKRQAHSVVFLKHGLRLYREPKGEDRGEFKKLEPYDPESSTTIEYDLEFARRAYEDIPEDLQVLAGKSDRPPPPEEWELESGDIVIRFLPDGTVDFGEYEDVPTFLFNESPPEGADIVIRQQGNNTTRGYLDIRPTGRTVFKVEEFEE